MRKIFFALLILLVLPGYAQTVAAQGLNPVVAGDEKLSYIGMTLAELIERSGAPHTVAAARGNEPWQDDVVFQYADADFFIHKDRVWQARFSSAFGISARDRKTSVMMLLGNTAEDKGNHALLAIPDRSWPIVLRVNFNNSNQVSAIYIYRSDF